MAARKLAPFVPGTPRTAFMSHRADKLVVMVALPPQVAATAARQDGVVSRRQLVDAGVREWSVPRRVRTGLLVPLGPETYRIAGAPESWRGRLRAALLELGDEAAISHRAAAAVHGFDGYPATPVEVTVPRHQRRRELPDVVVHSSRRWPRIDRCRSDGLLVTSPARTIIDLAGRSTGPELERAIGSALRDGGTSETFLRRRLSDLRGPGRDGVRLLDRVLADGVGLGHSELERAFLRLVERAGLERPRCQVTLDVRGERVRVDFLFERRRLIVEVDGHGTHATREARQRDALRRNELALLGFVVGSFTTADVFERAPWVEDWLRRAGVRSA
jgi:very-short-patch-repair endonuclease